MSRRPNPDKNRRGKPSTAQAATKDQSSPALLSETAGAEDAAPVGQRLRDLRHKQGLSIRALAVRSGLAINTLSMIENEKTSPSVSTLQVLARALQVPIGAFFEQERSEKRMVAVRQGQRPMVSMGTTRLEHLGKDLAGNAVQPFVVTLEPGAGSGHSPIVHTGHEFAYCLSGQIRYTFEDETVLLEPGDSIVFESHLPHYWQNTGTTPAQIILVLIPADARDEPVERHFHME